MTKFVAQKVVPLSVVLMKNKGTSRSLFKNVKIFFTSPWSLGVRVPWSVCKGEGMNTRFGRREKEVSTRSGKRKWVLGKCERGGGSGHPVRGRAGWKWAPGPCGKGEVGIRSVWGGVST